MQDAVGGAPVRAGALSSFARSRWFAVRGKRRASAACAILLGFCLPASVALADVKSEWMKTTAKVLTLKESSDRPTTDMGTMSVTGYRIFDSWKSYSSFSRQDWFSGIREGGARGFSGTDSAKEQETGDERDRDICEKDAPPPTSGNPVVLATGNKVEHELDFASGGEMGLYLARTYNHHWSAVGLFGRHWISNLDYTLAPSGNGSVLWAQRPDGRRIRFTRNAQGDRWLEHKAEAVAYITREPNGHYVLHNETNGTERYDAQGYILQLTNEQGISWHFTYENKYLKEVAHTSGRRMRLSWDNGRLVQVTDPAGAVYRYGYDDNAFGSGAARHRLESATLPGEPATTIRYHYEDGRMPGALTGKSFNGTRYSTFAYDANGRAILSEHAGGVERYTFSYAVEASEPVVPPPAPPPPGGLPNLGDPGLPWCEYLPGTGEVCYVPRSMPGPDAGVMSASTRPRPTRLRVTETNPLGRVTVHLYEDGRKVSITGEASPNCPASYRELSYDGNGYMDVVGDFADKLTDFDYNARGQLQKRIEAVGTPYVRTTTYQWDEERNRVLRETLVGEQEVSYRYAADGRITSVAVKNLSPHGVTGQVRTTTYAYTRHGNGMPATMTVRGPSGTPEDRVVSTYSATGDLLSVENGLGHRTVYSGHNARGQPGRIVGPNGDATEYTYDARGRIVEVRAIVGGIAQRSRYTYDGAGRLASVTDPDGVTQTYVYDAAGRLLRTYRPDPEGGWEQLRHTYNTASQVVSTEVQWTSSVVAPAVAPSLSAPALGAQGAFSLSWNAVSGAESYRLEESLAGASWTRIYTGTARSRALNGKPAGQHRYRVRACNEAGCGPVSAARTVSVVYRPTAAPVVSAPGQNTTGSFTVTWSAVANAPRYRLEESANGGGWSVIQESAATSRAFQNKPAGTYRYRVSGCNDAGCGPVSAVVAVNRIVPPAAVPALTVPVVNSTGSYTVSWAAVPTATTYELEERVGGAGTWNRIHSGAAVQVSLTGRRTDLVHAYRGRACNPAGCGAYSATRTVPPPLPAAATVNAPAQNTTGSYAVSWGVVAHANRYRLEESTNGGAWTLLQESAATSRALQGKPGGTYRYRVAACNEAGCGSMSAIVSVARIVPPAGAPAVTAPAVSSGSFSVSWTAVATATRYELQEAVQSGGWSTIHNGSARSVALTGRSVNYMYAYRARACNAAGCGPYSSVVLVIPPIPPEPPCPPPGPCIPRIAEPPVDAGSIGSGQQDAKEEDHG